LMKRLEIRLNSCATGRVRTGDGQSYGLHNIYQALASR
jgi:hypothetical protein